MQFPLDIQNTPNLPRYFWHPSVVFVPEEFGGHKWWMAQTPFPPCKMEPYRDRYELPCIHYSDDGFHWLPIPNNPIDDITKEQEANKDFMSDPHLIYKDGHLEIYYRLSFREGEHVNHPIIIKRISKDGLNWSDRQIIADMRDERDVAAWGSNIVSQSIVWTGAEYLCWYVDGSWFVEDRHVRLATSKDGVHWEESKICLLNEYKEKPWHIDVQGTEGVYHMLCYSYESDKLSHLTSKDGINWNFDAMVLTHSRNLFGFYSSKIYRSCMVAIEGTYHVFFSAATTYRSYIGLLKTRDWKHFEFVGPKVNWQYIVDVPVMLVLKVFRRIRKMFKGVK